MHHIQDKLGVKSMSDLTIKEIKGIYETKTPTKEKIRRYKKYIKEYSFDLTDIYIHEELALLIIDCWTPRAIEFIIKLGFNQLTLIMTKEKSVLTKIMKVFASEKYYCSTLF